MKRLHAPCPYDLLRKEVEGAQSLGVSEMTISISASVHDAASAVKRWRRKMDQPQVESPCRQLRKEKICAECQVIREVC